MVSVADFFFFLREKWELRVTVPVGTQVRLDRQTTISIHSIIRFDWRANFKKPLDCIVVMSFLFKKTVIESLQLDPLEFSACSSEAIVFSDVSFCVLHLIVHFQ